MSCSDGNKDLVETLYTYVVFSIDLAASLDGEVDEDALQSWERFEPQQYVGLADTVNVWACEDYHPLKQFEMNFVLQGPLRSSRKHFITESMTIPITPDTYIHPEGRQPFTLSNAFPWKDCYHSSPLAASVLCQTTLPSSPNACRIVEEDRKKFFKTEQRDSSVAGAAEIEAEESGKPLPEETPEDRRLPFQEAREYALSDRYVVVTLSTDLSSVERPADPARFFEEAVYVEQLRQEVVDRQRRETARRDAEAFSVPESSASKTASLRSAEESTSRPSPPLTYGLTWFGACRPIATMTLSMLRHAKAFGLGLLCRPTASDS